MSKKKLFISAIASLILSLIVLSEVSYMLLDDPVEYRTEEQEENRDLEELEESESENKFKRLLKLPSFEGVLASTNTAHTSFFHSKAKKGISGKARLDLPLFILFCQLKVDFC